ncbi:histone-lysine N-methyltransferase ATX2-like protein isoform X1, partial [Tanacetum coccineum]
KDLNCVNDEGSIGPLGYKGYKEVSFISRCVCSVYKMEVLRDTTTQTRPLFRVTTNNGDQEYANKLFLQCDKCRMMVHARCYEELEPVDGVLWLCNLCRPGAPEVSPPCCLCPVTGGAMKPTTDGRWAHLACAMWIPETCLSDIKKMEPVDGINRISKVITSIRTVGSFYVAFVVFLMELVSSVQTMLVMLHIILFALVLLDFVLRLQVVPLDEDEENQCIRLLSFCKRHSPNHSTERVAPDERIGQLPSQQSDILMFFQDVCRLMQAIKDHERVRIYGASVRMAIWHAACAAPRALNHSSGLGTFIDKAIILMAKMLSAVVTENGLRYHSDMINNAYEGIDSSRVNQCISIDKFYEQRPTKNIPVTLQIPIPICQRRPIVSEQKPILPKLSNGFCSIPTLGIRRKEQ